MPKDTPSQKECNLRFRPLFDLPRLCQNPDKLFEIFVVFDQTIENKSINVAGSGILCKNRIEKGSVTDRALNQLIYLHGGTGAHKNDIDRQKSEKENRGDKENFLYSQRGIPFEKELLKNIIEEK
jgi:hypothetical protein